MIVGYAALERQVASLHREFRSLRQGEEAAAAPRRSAVVLAAELGVSLDPWQRGTLETDRDALLLVTRQGGKGMVASLLALEALEDPGSTTVIIAKADRQAKRLLRRVKRLYRSLPDALPTVVDSPTRWSSRMARRSWPCRDPRRPFAAWRRSISSSATRPL